MGRVTRDSHDERLRSSGHLSLAFEHLKQAVAEAFGGGAGTSSYIPATYSATSPLDLDSPREKHHQCIIDPTATWKGKWDLLVMAMIGYSACVVPVRLGFEAEARGNLWTFEAAMSLVFITDLMLSFRTAYVRDDTGRWERDPARIASRYLRGWFWIDAPSSVPVELIEMIEFPTGASGEGDASGLKLLRILRMFRLVRLLRLLKLGEYITSLEEALDVNLRPLRMLQLVLKLVFIAHLLACGFFYVGSHAAEGEASWISSYADGTAVDAELSQQYLFSIYWALTTLTTVGYGDITPANDSERTFVTFTLLGGSLVFAYILGDVASLLATMDRQSVMVGERMDSVKEYLTWREIPRELGIRVRRYFDHYYKSRPVFDELGILADLNPQLHSEIVQNILSRTLGRLPLFTRLSADFFEEVFPLVKPIFFDANEVIFRRGQLSKELLFLLEGAVDVLSEVDEATPVRRIKPNSEAILSADGRLELVSSTSEGCFGQSVLLGRRRDHTHVAAMAVECLMIEKHDLEKLVATDPISSRRFCGMVLKDQKARDRLRSFSFMLRLAGMKRTGEAGRQRAACLIQFIWRRYTDASALEDNSIYQMIFSNPNAGTASKLLKRHKQSGPRPRSPSKGAPGGGRGGEADVAGMMAIVVQRLDSLEATNREVRHLLQVSARNAAVKPIKAAKPPSSRGVTV